jgi:hypothetical protein
MATHATYDDVNLILRLYELRREEKIRQARNWFVTSFKAHSLEELNRLCPPGSEENAYFRMLMSYWDMAASFVTAEVLNEELFFQNGRELLFIWERIRDLVPLIRSNTKDPTFLRNLETVAKSFGNWLQGQSPEAYAAFSARVRGVPG